MDYQNNLYVKEDDKVLVSELLFYMQNKLNCFAHDDIVKICSNTYTEETVKKEKQRFFLAIGKKVNPGRGEVDKKCRP